MVSEARLITQPSLRAPRRKPPDLHELPVDPIESAQAAGLRYVHDTGPGIRRKRAGEDFVYIGLDGKPIRDKREIERIKALGIPPAYTDVWICPYANGHLQATGRDAKGRKQYRYHDRWREVRDGTKYGRMVAFSEALPKIRSRVRHDLARHGMPREKLLATVTRLLETTMIRVGNEEYARANQSFGLTTLQDGHVEVDGGTVHFHFRGKSGKVHNIDLADRRLAGIVRRCQELPGQELFEYVGAHGEVHPISSSDVNCYLRETAGEDFTAKDFRTWAGTVLAALALVGFEPAQSDAQAKKNIALAIKHVSERLGNTPAVCRKCYVHPEILRAYLDNTLIEALGELPDSPIGSASEGLSGEESAVAALLRRTLQNQSTCLPGA